MSMLQPHISDSIPSHQIRAVYDETTIRVYQAYSNEIADSALKRGTFISPPFKMERMTWIKPSFLWMMYRSGWGYKDLGQARILAIDMTREGFKWALDNSCPSHAPTDMPNEDWVRLKDISPVRVQWDPERDLFLMPQQYRAIQIGLGKVAVEHYIKNWIVKITDVTPLAHSIHKLIELHNVAEAQALLPQERPYPL